jgi:hypothetical protein
MQFSGLTYYPFSNNQTFDISFRNKTGEIHSFRLFAGGDIVIISSSPKHYVKSEPPALYS